ncbi:HlyD family efflux transporter periplasmic adaptor subunit [Caulobacter sp. B11]|uniref:HlyD family efflux transporter periplasmic adaptor subunit n=1 Tax=Caulobacter sp. B11 TaxID=2048899 RepID=UPI0011804B72
MARDGLVELDAEVGEAQLSSLRPGQAAMVTLPDGRAVSGTVRMVSPRIDATSRLGKARFDSRWIPACARAASDAPPSAPPVGR